MTLIILRNLNDIKNKDLNVGDTLTVFSVNRETGEITFGNMEDFEEFIQSTISKIKAKE